MSPNITVDAIMAMTASRLQCHRHRCVVHLLAVYQKQCNDVNLAQTDDGGLFL